MTKQVEMMPKEEKEKLIKKEITRLKRLFKELTKEKQAAAEALISEAAFMRVTLQEARYIIDKQGILDWFEQGTNQYYREHPATKVYNTMIQRYSSVCKQIFDMIPNNEETNKAEDELIAFLKK